MCGIGGVVRMTNTAPIIAPETLFWLLCSLAHRGHHASGIALNGPDGLFVYKAAQPAASFIATEATKDFLAHHLTPRVVSALVHTRYWTKGSPQNNNNNHPLYNGGVAVVHNGHIQNDNALFSDWKLERGAETDSDIIRATLDLWGLSKEGASSLSELEGSAAFAAVSPSMPNHVLLGRANNPLEVLLEEERVMFASTKAALFQASQSWIQRWGFTAKLRRGLEAFTQFPTDTVSLLGPEGLEWTVPLSMESRLSYPSYSSFRWLKEVRCVPCKKNFTVPKAKRHMRPEDFTCTKCKGPVIEKEVTVGGWA